MAACGNCRISRHSSSLISQSLNIDLAVNNTVLKTFALSKDISVLSDHILAAKNKILCGLALTGTCIDISADQSCRLSAYKSSSVGILSNHLITCRQIDNNMRSVYCMADTRRCRNPEIFAELCCYCKFRIFLTLKDHVCSKGNLIPELILIVFVVFEEVHKLHVFFLCTCKLSLLIKLIIVGDMCFRNKSNDTAMIQSCSHIIELSSVTKRHSHKDQCICLLCLLSDMKKLLPRTVQKTSLEKKIMTGVSRNTEFRKYHQLYMLFFHFADGPQDLLSVCLAVCNCDSWCCCCHLDKTMLHFFFLLLLIACIPL